jgi:predicted nuclease of predicted toxin-antitoxin system
MRLILDENLPPALARSLDALSSRDGHSVTHIRDLVGSGALDTTWIAAAAQEIDPVVVSGDRRMLTREHELRALRAHNLTTFILGPGWSDRTFWDKAWLLTRWWPKFIDVAGRAPHGTIFRVPHRNAPADLRPHF